jgi:hypothetical protein
MKTIISCFAATVLLLDGSALSADSQFLAEFMRLTQERDKALAAAEAPINKKYEAALTDLLRRATKANDLDAALKIRSTIESLTAAKAAAIDPAQVKTKRALQKALIGTTWSLAGTLEDARKTKHTFTLAEAEAQWSDNTKSKWEPVDDRTIRFGPSGEGAGGTVLFDAALTTFQCPDWYGSGPRHGVRRSQ